MCDRIDHSTGLGEILTLDEQGVRAFLRKRDQSDDHAYAFSATHIEPFEAREAFGKCLLDPFSDVLHTRAAIRLGFGGKDRRVLTDQFSARDAVDLFGCGVAFDESAFLHQQDGIWRKPVIRKRGTGFQIGRWAAKDHVREFAYYV